MRKSAYFITHNRRHRRSLSGRLNRELALVERSEKSFWVTRDERPRVHAPIICIQSVSKEPINLCQSSLLKQTSLGLSRVTSLRTSAWDAMIRVDSNRATLNHGVQFLCHERSAATCAKRPLPHPPPLLTSAKLRYCHVRRDSVLSLCIC